MGMGDWWQGGATQLTLEAGCKMIKINGNWPVKKNISAQKFEENIENMHYCNQAVRLTLIYNNMIYIKSHPVIM